MESISTVSQFIKEKRLSPVELTNQILKRISKIDTELNSFITVMETDATKQAKLLEEEMMAGKIRGPLHGIPIAVKDIIQVQGQPTTSGSIIFEKWVPDEDATVVKKLKKAGAIIIGKANLHEFAMGATTENPHYGNVKNPWNLNKIPGGSSGGSAVAVAAGLSYGALGTDTAGSIRLPAALCGIVGIKPTYGRVSRNGCLPFSWSLDHIGPMTRTVKDAAIMLEAISGYDSKDTSSVKHCESINFADPLIHLKGIRIGICKDYLFDDLNEEVQLAITRAIERLRELGAQIIEIELKNLSMALNSLKVIAQSEVVSFHQPLLNQYGHLYGDDLKYRFKFGKAISAVDYINAQRLRNLFIEQTLESLQNVDVLIGPTNSQPPFDIGSVLPEEAINNMFSLGKTPLANILGFPALTVPCGIINGHLPTGMQLIGKPFSEKLLLQIGDCYERQETWFEQYMAKLAEN